MKRWFIESLLWLTPAVAFLIVQHIVSDGGSWWWWVAAVAVGISHSALLQLYVRESYRAAVSAQMEA